MPKPAELITPTSGTMGFSWDPGENVIQYWLEIGSAAGMNDLYNKDQGKNLSVIVTGLPISGTIYIRLWSKIDSAWYAYEYPYVMPEIGIRRRQTGLISPLTNPAFE
jgi:hypothetical protein